MARLVTYLNMKGIPQKEAGQGRASVTGAHSRRALKTLKTLSQDTQTPLRGRHYIELGQLMVTDHQL